MALETRVYEELTDIDCCVGRWPGGVFVVFRWGSERVFVADSSGGYPGGVVGVGEAVEAAV